MAPPTFVFLPVETVSRIEDGSVSKCGSRLSAAHTRSNNLQELHGLTAVPFQHVVLALAPRTIVYLFK
eukprot:5830850-Pyramimonas_sp.AAC.1